MTNPTDHRQGLSAKARTAVLTLLFMAGILNYVDRSMISVLKPMLQAELGWTDDDYGYLTAAFQLAAVVTYLFAGQVVDWIGWRWANPLAVGAWSLAAMSHAFAVTISQFTWARIALGSTEAFGTPLGVKTVASFFSLRERSFALGLQNASGNVGAIITPLVIPGMAVLFGWQACFIGVGVAGLIWVVAWMAMAARIRPVKPENEIPDDGAEPQPARAPLSQVLVDRRTWAIAGGKVLSDVNWWFLLFWIPDIFNRQFHLEMRDFGVPLAVIFAMAGCGSLLGGFASGRLLAAGFSINAARKLTMLACACLMAPIPLVLAVDNYWLAVLILGVALAGHQGFSVSIFTLTTDMVPNTRVGTVISIGALCGNLAGTAVLRLAGFWIGQGYGYAPFLLFSCVAYFLALAWIHLLVPKVVEHG
jgi:ACS family hexuronate transporter-like MFS transporter